MEDKIIIEETTNLIQNLFINDNLAKILTSENQILLYNFIHKIDCQLQVKYTLKQLELLIFTDHIITGILENLNPTESNNIGSPSITTTPIAYTTEENHIFLNNLLEAKKIFQINNFEFSNGFYGVSIIDYNYFNNHLPIIVKIINDFDNGYNVEKQDWCTYNKTEIENINLPCGEIEYLNLVSICKALKLEDIKTPLDYMNFNQKDIINFIVKDISFTFSNTEVVSNYNNVYSYFMDTVYNELERINTNPNHNTMFIIVEIGKTDEKENIINYIESFINSYVKHKNFKISIKQSNRMKNRKINFQLAIFKK